MKMSTWQPTATLENLKARAKMISVIRDFFAGRNVLEVETPLLSHGTITDPHIQAIPAFYKVDEQSQPITLYLQTSPEYAMKRLLAEQRVSIYQICKVFRQSEKGHLHNPEFTMIEWYRIGFDHLQLMDECDELLQLLLNTPRKAERFSYAELFQTILSIDPHTADLQALKSIAKKNKIELQSELNNRDAWLSLLMSHCIEPQLGFETPTFIYDFPASQAALAKIRNGAPPLASRFELYYRGIELANGFHELSDASEQRKRFENDLQFRKMNDLPAVAIDDRLLAALEKGLPDCAGVALGLDRLIMLALQSEEIKAVLSFDFQHA